MLACFVLGIAAMLTALPYVLALLLASNGFLVAGGVALYLALQRKERRPRQLTIENRTLSLDGESVLSVEHIQWATTKVADCGEHRIHFLKKPQWNLLSRRAWEPLLLDLIVRDEVEAEEILRAMNVSSDRSTLAIPLRGTTWWHAAVPLVIYLALSIALFPTFLRAGDRGIEYLVSLNIGFVLASIAIRIFSKVEVSVGADGVHVRRFGRSRFLPFSELDAMHADGNELRFVLAGGEVVVVPIRYRKAAQALGDRISHERKRQRDQFDESVPYVLGRGDRSPNEWLCALREVGHGHATDYRIPIASTQSLRRAVDNRTLEPGLRTAAAFALRIREGEGARAQLRLAAATSADPELRVAFERIESGIEGFELETLRARR